MSRKGKIVGESFLIISLFIELLPLGFLFFNCAIPLDTSSVVNGKFSAEFSLIHLWFVAFNELFLTVVFSSPYKSFEKCSIPCLGGISSTELDLNFPLRVFNVTRTVLDYLLRFLVL